MFWKPINNLVLKTNCWKVAAQHFVPNL